MTALLLPMPFLTALDSTGRPVAGARLYLYEQDSTTNAAAYTTWELNTPHDQPIVADAAGRFPAIYLQDLNEPYRAVLKDADGAVIADIEPINRKAGTIGNADLATGPTVTANKCDPDLIYELLDDHHPVLRDGDTMTGDLILKTTPAPSAAPPGLAGFRNITFETMDDDHTVGLGDVGRGLLHSAADGSGTVTYTIPQDLDEGVGVPWGSGSGFAVYNDTPGQVTIAKHGTVELRFAGSTTPRISIAIQEGGFASFFRVSENKWICSGAGVS